MVSIPSVEMSKLLHRLRVLLLRTLLFVGLAQLAAPGDGPWKVLFGEPVRALPSAPGADASGEETPSPFEQLRGEASAEREIDDADPRRRRLNVRSALPSLVLPNVFCEESVRIRAEDRRSCRPPNRVS